VSHAIIPWVSLSCPTAQDEYDFTKLHTQVRVLLALPSPSPFPTPRFNPTSSNLRISGVPLTTPTPIYNNTLVLQQATLSKSLLLTFHTFASEVPHFADAVKLLRVWANQRGFGRGTKKWSVRGFEDKGLWWAAIIVLLVHGEKLGPGERKKRKTLGKGLSSYQFFRAALDFLGKLSRRPDGLPDDLAAAHHDFGEESVFMKPANGEGKVRRCFSHLFIAKTDLSVARGLRLGGQSCSSVR
jgi:U3 small nucleolar RNA-associated protein 22